MLESMTAAGEVVLVPADALRGRDHHAVRGSGQLEERPDPAA